MAEYLSKSQEILGPSDDDLKKLGKDVDLLKLQPDDLLGYYFGEINKYPLLNEEEEIRLTQRVREGVVFSSGVTNLKVEEATSDGREALDRLVCSNLRLSVWQAKKNQGRGVELIDLVQHGNIGLITAAAKYEPKLGFRFSTYATWWVRQAIQRAVFDKSRAIRLPVHIGEEMQHMRRVVGGLAQELGRQPNSKETADRLGVSADRVEKIVIESSQISSLQEPVGDGNGEFGDGIPDKSQEDVADGVIEREKREIAASVLSNIKNEREKLMIALRFGFVDGKSYTLDEVGKKFGITRERVRQIESEVLKRARSSGNLRRIRHLLD